MTEDVRSTVRIEAVFTSWSDAESARRALELLHPNQLRIESLPLQSEEPIAKQDEEREFSPTAVIGGFSGELNVLSLISDDPEMLSNGQVYDMPETIPTEQPKQGILLTVSVTNDSFPQAAEMITQNGGRFY
ncbi:hypothetical protein ASD24_05890 [Paenibacillus sp. Root52]|uniref:Uncharacterized protein n=1 Tax=Paenibacillus amylolyticus TaxID=1451 RepID=A0AAP5H7T1_PAEAM|nr:MULTISPECIES: hypothetical protein [Paenibacillus]KQY87389.1 hypothetical protein ASD24_05890 [Paenibacillus sp. Root52]MDR6725476.1 hypothetical protein [Paenibacillus amylolyticus]